MTYYNRIRQLREERKLTQEEIANFLHITRVSYCNYELGKREIPIDTLITLADIYDTSVDYILGRTKIKKPYPYT